MNLSVVLQGPVYSWTPSFIRKFKEFSFVREIILSTWDGQNVEECEADHIIKNPNSYSPGKGNRNLQIVSSFAGVMRANCALALKCRTDMFLPKLDNMYNYFLEDKKYYNEIFTLSLYPRFAFHPRDHVFLGKIENLVDLFNIPLDETHCKYDEFKDVRSETYIGAHYCAQRDYRVQKFIQNPEEYLTDAAPKRSEALAVWHDMIRKNENFIPFPKYAIEWPKYYPQGYPFKHLQSVYGELYGDEFF